MDFQRGASLSFPSLIFKHIPSSQLDSRRGKTTFVPHCCIAELAKTEKMIRHSSLISNTDLVLW